MTAAVTNGRDHKTDAWMITDLVDYRELDLCPAVGSLLKCGEGCSHYNDHDSVVLSMN